MYGLADKLAFLGAKLEGNSFDTTKEDKKILKNLQNEIKPKININ